MSDKDIGKVESEQLELPEMVPSAAEYTDDKIRTLSDRDHIRLRPGMYIGRLGDGEHADDGIYVLLKEVTDNSIDEFTMGFGRRIIISIQEDGLVSVRDFGRGIPLDKVRDCVSRANTGGKFLSGDERVFSGSIGMNGIGLKAVNFLSETFEATSWRGGKFVTVEFAEGNFVKQSRGSSDEPDGTLIKFKPSRMVFPDYHFDEKIVERRMQHYVWLCARLSIECNGQKFYSQRGLLDLMADKVGDENRLYDVIHYKSKDIDFAFCHTNSSNENYYSFVNTQYTSDGGTHLAAFKEGIVKAVNELAPKDKPFEPDDIRSGITGVIAFRMNDPQFESQTKNKLVSTDVRAPIVNEVRAALVDYLYKHSDIKDAIFEKISKNESIRKQIQNIKKASKEMAQQSLLKIQKLRDCKYHLNECDRYRKDEDKNRCLESMLFLTEGDSAAGSVVSSRNANTQAVFALRGKVENCYGLTREVIYKNKELYGVMLALGAEDDLDNLRYAKVVIATDADSDGLHIRLLLITFFLTFFPQLVSSEHLFILETPLFRVRNKTHDPIYCYSEAERDDAAKKIGKDSEITRFKGLGEISPVEFGQFIGENIRLRPVTVDHARDLDGLLRFLMGDNTPDRRDFIMNNLL